MSAAEQLRQLRDACRAELLWGGHGPALQQALRHRAAAYDIALQLVMFEEAA